MAKSKTKLNTEVDVLPLDYQLAELPSSQHRAGLAGLVLVIKWLERQPDFQEKINKGTICRITRFDTKGASFEINQAGLEALFDEVYAASQEFTKSTKLRTKKSGETIPPIREEEEEVIDKKTGKPKIDKKTGLLQTKKFYIYPVVVPQGSFLADEQYDKTPNSDWVKLWRNALWEILKCKPATRLPFNARAEGEYKEDSSKAWTTLTKHPNKVVELPGSFFLGAQAKNAEVIPFQDVACFQFLLHFWFYCASIYIPRKTKFERDKETKEIIEKREFLGYVIAIPDITNLKVFCHEFLEILRNRGEQLDGYRPRDAVVDLALESALDTMKRLKDRLKLIEGDKPTYDLISGFDVIHAKPGEDVKFLGITRIEPDFTMADDYAQIRQNYWSPLFRRQRLMNLFNHQSWYTGFDAMLCSLPYEQSIENDYFCRDVREAFNNEIAPMDEETATVTETNIEQLVFRLVETYVRRKLEFKHKLEFKAEWKPLLATKERRDELNKRPDYKEYTEKKAKIAKTAFLDVRSRTEQRDFINYFVSSLCSVPQYMRSEDYVSLTKALYEDSDRIRTLTLLALSANS
ncbi:hypothetical protein AMR41_08305 [Hapalosiphon sp. MRB220]|nr:hypothetical protein AMR41_08305 [Hapalosiphon sp. MRB220]